MYMNKAYHEIVSSLSENTKLIVVSKKRSLEEIMSYYEAGVRDFGENRADDLIKKAQVLPKDIRWHFIGHLQRNKVAKVLPYVTLIHSVESKELLQVIEKEAQKLNKTVPVLIQFNLAEESTKTGLMEEQAFQFVKEALSFEHLNIKGIMTMGPHVEDEKEIEKIFMQAHQLLQELQKTFGFEHFTELSMGMSSDWKIALQHGSTMLRIGTILFE
ncbi:MAG: YggS family pyridoxal phosphate-dependent enzyme [Erysipelotrichaceae bacterium]|nr:YggS family pyridoxal phosphate-dependent enzyme [Erysipelotrichaceae bacterium]